MEMASSLATVFANKLNVRAACTAIERTSIMLFVDVIRPIAEVVCQICHVWPTKIVGNFNHISCAGCGKN